MPFWFFVGDFPTKIFKVKVFYTHFGYDTMPAMFLAAMDMLKPLIVPLGAVVLKGEI
ncbi:hypothetical protein [Tichowtungia aerotolerans]|uniref:Uncharacterized protein n=1 Tax=Tichowtungia aerotolerans TaxID=2697043 RepID=A0A6P1M8E4_9BACT|nr:hypothetical protein [Tichowtungia aerotolerans]QHI68794.1 hypothetical protein GT409_04800 [Tichowtungia aerotolerans]